MRAADSGSWERVRQLAAYGQPTPSCGRDTGSARVPEPGACKLCADTTGLREQQGAGAVPDAADGFGIQPGRCSRGREGSVAAGPGVREPPGPGARGRSGPGARSRWWQSCVPDHWVGAAGRRTGVFQFGSSGLGVLWQHPSSLMEPQQSCREKGQCHACQGPVTHGTCRLSTGLDPERGKGSIQCKVGTAPRQFLNLGVGFSRGYLAP